MSQSEASGCKDAPDQEMKPAEEDCFQILWWLCRYSEHHWYQSQRTPWEVSEVCPSKMKIPSCWNYGVLFTFMMSEKSRWESSLLICVQYKEPFDCSYRSFHESFALQASWTVKSTDFLRAPNIPSMSSKLSLPWKPVFMSVCLGGRRRARSANAGSCTGPKRWTISCPKIFNQCSLKWERSIEKQHTTMSHMMMYELEFSPDLLCLCLQLCIHCTQRFTVKLSQVPELFCCGTTLSGETSSGPIERGRNQDDLPPNGALLKGRPVVGWQRILLRQCGIQYVILMQFCLAVSLSLG